MPLTQGDHLMAAKASNQAMNSHSFDNDANFDPALNSNSADYFKNSDTAHSWDAQNRWLSGGGIDVDQSGKVGGRAQDANSRDVDGTIDRVKDPPKELLPLLYAMKLHCASYNVNLLECFFDAGGSRFGTIPTTKFGSALVHALSRLNLSVEMITSLVDHYGCGDPVDKRSAYSRLAQFEQVAFMDLCEDVDKAENVSDTQYPFPFGGPQVPEREMR